MAAVRALCLLLVAVSLVNCQNSLSFLNGNYIMEWSHLEASNEIQFKVTVKTTGYVALGISNFNSAMKNIDVMIGTVVGGTPSVKDYWVATYATPDLDSQQDFTLVSGSEANGETVLTFKRKLDTGDSSGQDIKIEIGSTYYIAVALGSTDDLIRHTSRAYSFSKIELVPQPTPTPSPPPPPPPPSPTPLSSSSSATAPTTSTPSTTSRAKATMTSSSSSTPTSEMPSPTTVRPSSPSPSPPPSPTPLSSSSSATAPTTSIPSTASTAKATMTSSSSSTPTSEMPRPTPTTTVSPSSSAMPTRDATAPTISIPSTTSTAKATMTSSSPSKPTSEMPSPTPTTTVRPSSSAMPTRDNLFSFKDGSVSWNVDRNTNEISFTMKVKATGWLGLGITTENKDMKDMDIVIGGVFKNNTGYIGQYFSTTTGKPSKNKLNVQLVQSKEMNGETTVTFKRLLNTGDSKDIIIKPDTSYYLAWAYHKTSDDLTIHDERGYSSKMVLIKANNNPTTTATTTKPNASSKTSSTISLVFMAFAAVLML